MASSATSSAPQPAEPSPDVLASIITQVSPTGQPARAPARRKPTNTGKPKPGQPARKPSTSTAKPPPTTSQPASTPATQPKQAEAGASTLSEKALPASPAQQGPSTTATKPTAPRPASPRKRKRKAGFFDSLLGFLTCSSPSKQAQQFDDSSSTTKANGKSASSLLTSPVVAKNTTSKSRDVPSAPVPLKEVTPSTSPAPSAPTAAVAASTSNDPGSVDAAALSSQEAVANTSREGATLPRSETADVLSGAVVPPGKEAPGQGTPGRKGRRRSARASTGTGAGDTTQGSATQVDDDASEMTEDQEEEEEFASEEDDEDRLILQGGMGIPVDENGQPRPLLMEIGPVDTGRKCLVLDLDETLVHSSFKMIHSADYVVPVEIENQSHNVYVIKRPGVDQFLQKMGQIYEVVVFTASLSKYADPVLDQLDVHRVVRHRLFRESCYNHKGNYVKDLSQLGRPIGDTIIIDNSPASYIFHPKNAVPVSSWFNDPHDTELTDLLGVLTDLADVPDVRGVLDSYLDMETDLGSREQSMGDVDEQLAKSTTSASLPPPLAAP